MVGHPFEIVESGHKPLLTPAMWRMLMLALAAGLAWPALMLAPNHYDSCMFVWMGKRMLAGELPYRDLWDNKLPVLYWINALAAASGRPVAALYVLQSLAIGAGGWMIFGLARRAFSIGAAGLAGLAYVSLAATPATLDTGNLTENWAAPWAILCVYALVRYVAARPWALHWPLLSGLGLGFAAALRPPAILIGAALLVLLPSLARRSRMSRWATTIWLIVGAAVWLAGLAVAPAAAVAWARAKGIFQPMLESCILFNASYGANSSLPAWANWRSVGQRLWDLVVDTWVWHLAAFQGLLLVLLGNRSLENTGQNRLAGTQTEGDASREGISNFKHQISNFKLGAVTVVWLIAAFASALPSMRFYRHHYYLTLAPVALLSGWAWQALLAKAWGQNGVRNRLSSFGGNSYERKKGVANRFSAGRVSAWAILALAGFFVAVHFNAQINYALYSRIGAKTVDQAEAYLLANGRPTDTLFVFGWGAETDLFGRLNWPCSTRHAMALFYPDLPDRDRLLAEWRQQMRQRQPDWIVCSQREDLIAGPPPRDFGWKHPDALALFRDLQAEYAPLYELANRFAACDHAGQPAAWLSIYRKRGFAPTTGDDPCGR